MLLNLGLWLLKSLSILAIFHFSLPPIINSATRNSWLKLPIMITVGLLAGVFMAWLHYVPYVLFFLWLALNKYSLDVMAKATFEGEAQITNKPVFYISTYSYIIIACVTAWFLQMEAILGSDPNGPGFPLFRHLFRL
jgi:hypothetical protein